MNTWGRYLGQGIIYLIFVAFIGYFSTSPSYTHVPVDKALIKFTFTHAGKRIKPIHDMRTKADLAKLPPQLRAIKHSRERAALEIEFEMDGKMLFQAKVSPRGLSHDLPSPIYQRFTVPVGKHHFRVRMKDDVHVKGFNYFGEKTMILKPLQTIIIDFDNIRKEFIFE
jgi:hypothetical protein